MLLITHVMIALTSIIFITIKLLKPSELGLKISYALIAATLATGTALVLVSHANVIQACTSGLLYLSIVSAGVMVARRQLQR